MSQIQEELREKFKMDSEMKTREEEAQMGARLEDEFNGFSTVAISFLMHFKDTLELAITLNYKGIAPTHLKRYEIYIVKLEAYHRDLRACYSMFRNGYPEQGFAQIRDIRDRVFTLTCIVNNILTMDELYPYNDQKNLHKSIKKAQNNKGKAFKELFSALSPETQNLYDQIKNCFHLQTHSAIYTLGELIENIKLYGHYKLHSDNRNSTIMFCCRFAEVLWMTHRLLPFCQLEANQFGEVFNRDWHLLDKNLFNLSGKTVNFSGKVIGVHIAEFMNIRLNFNPENYFLSP